VETIEPEKKGTLYCDLPDNNNNTWIYLDKNEAFCLQQIESTNGKIMFFSPSENCNYNSLSQAYCKWNNLIENKANQHNHWFSKIASNKIVASSIEKKNGTVSEAATEKEKGKLGIIETKCI